MTCSLLQKKVCVNNTINATKYFSSMEDCFLSVAPAVELMKGEF